MGSGLGCGASTIARAKFQAGAPSGFGAANALPASSETRGTWGNSAGSGSHRHRVPAGGSGAAGTQQRDAASTRKQPPTPSGPPARLTLRAIDWWLLAARGSGWAACMRSERGQGGGGLVEQRADGGRLAQPELQSAATHPERAEQSLAQVFFMLVAAQLCARGIGGRLGAACTERRERRGGERGRLSGGIGCSLAGSATA